MMIVCIMFGSRNRTGATIIPLTAPTAEASPHPSASIQLTWTPNSRLASGWWAAARNVRPTVVCWSSRYTHSSTTPVTAMTPTSR